MYSDELLAAYDEIIAAQKKNTSTALSSSPSTPTSNSPTTSSRPMSSSSAKAKKQPAPVESSASALNSPASTRGRWPHWPRRQNSAVSTTSVEEPMM